MNLTNPEILSALISLVGVPFAWWVLNRLNRLKEELDDYKVHIAENLFRNEFREMRKEIRGMMEDFKKDIYKHLDQKN